MGSAERFTLRTETVGCLPIVNHFLGRMGVGERLGTYLAKGDARLRLAPATVIGVVVRNIVVAHRPVYAIGEWAAPYAPALLGLGPGGAAALNDDRVAARSTGSSTERLARSMSHAFAPVVSRFSPPIRSSHWRRFGHAARRAARFGPTPALTPPYQGGRDDPQPSRRRPTRTRRRSRRRPGAMQRSAAGAGRSWCPRSARSGSRGPVPGPWQPIGKAQRRHSRRRAGLGVMGPIEGSGVGVGTSSRGLPTPIECCGVRGRLSLHAGLLKARRRTPTTSRASIRPPTDVRSGHSIVAVTPLGHRS